jgi:hypothetical protein
LDGTRIVGSADGYFYEVGDPTTIYSPVEYIGFGPSSTPAELVLDGTNGSLGDSSGWNIENKYIWITENLFPHETGWMTTTGTTPPPTIVFKVIAYRRADEAYVVVEREDTTFAIVRVSDAEILFVATTLDAVFEAAEGSEAEGTLEYGELDFHIEKLDYSEFEHTDNLDGPSEETITSIFEPTPLSRGPNFLEGNMKFRSSRGFIYVVRSNGGEISADGGTNWEDIDYSGLTADSNGFYTGMIEFNAHSGYVDYSTIQVRTSGIYPLNVTALALEVEKHERGGR